MVYNYIWGKDCRLVALPRQFRCLARWTRVRRARFWNSDYWASQLAIIYISHYFSENAKLCIYFDESWQFWKPSAQNCLFFQRLRINTDHYFFSGVLNKKIQRSDWLVSTMNGEKFITQPWWCQRWRNFISIFWSLNGHLDAWNQDYFDNIWCQNICQAKWTSFIFKLLKFNFWISRSWKKFEISFWLFLFLFWILNLAGRKISDSRSNLVQNFQKMPQFTKGIQKWQNCYSRNWLTRIFCRLLWEGHF